METDYLHKFVNDLKIEDTVENGTFTFNTDEL